MSTVIFQDKPPKRVFRVVNGSVFYTDQHGDKYEIGLKLGKINYLSEN